MKRMSFAWTTPAIRNRTKTVTRRHPDTWKDLKPGARLLAVEKGQGFRKGEKAPPPICQIEVVSVVRENIQGVRRVGEMEREGMPGRDPEDFIESWLKKYRTFGCRRIEFRYV